MTHLQNKSCIWVAIMLLVGILSIIPNPTEATETGLVAHWNFNEGSGNVLQDQSGNYNNGTINQASWRNGVTGKALEFDGFDDYVGVPYSDELAPANAITIGIWFNTSDVTQTAGALISKSEQGGFNIVYGPAGFTDYVTGNINIDGIYKSVALPITDITANKWHFVALTFNGTDIKIYLDGALKDSLQVSGSIAYTHDNSLMIRNDAGSGSSPTGDYFKGSIDEVKIYNRALAGSEIVTHYNEIISSGQPPSNGEETTNGDSTPDDKRSLFDETWFFGVVALIIVIIILIVVVVIKKQSSKEPEEPPIT